MHSHVVMTLLFVGPAPSPSNQSFIGWLSTVVDIQRACLGGQPPPKDSTCGRG
jgi:hypothetical protein